MVERAVAPTFVKDWTTDLLDPRADGVFAADLI